MILESSSKVFRWFQRSRKSSEANPTFLKEANFIFPSWSDVIVLNYQWFGDLMVGLVSNFKHQSYRTFAQARPLENTCWFTKAMVDRRPRWLIALCKRWKILILRPFGISNVAILGGEPVRIIRLEKFIWKVISLWVLQKDYFFFPNSKMLWGLCRSGKEPGCGNRFRELVLGTGSGNWLDSGPEALPRFQV